MSRPDHVREIKSALTDPFKVCSALGMLEDRRSWQRQPRGIICRCPVHGDKTPSCSVQDKGGYILWKCHACDASGDVLSLVAAVYGYNTGSQFGDVLLAAAELGGLHDVVNELRTGRVQADRPRPVIQQAEPEPERDYPPLRDVLAFWETCAPVTQDEFVASWLASRKLEPGLVESRDLARALRVDGASPRWASKGGQSWSRLGHRLILPMYDATGNLRSVRAGRICDGETPKRLPPGGFKASGLVMADALGVAMLGGHERPRRLIATEGEPDFLTWATRALAPGSAVIGLVSGSWSDDFAKRVPIGCMVFVRADHDHAGARYSRTLVSSLRNGRVLRGWAPHHGAKDQNDLLLAGKLPADPASDSRPIVHLADQERPP